MIGRAYLWGLAANGQAGVENVLDVLRSGVDSAAARPRQAVGAGPVAGRPADPGPGFRRDLGVPAAMNRGADLTWPEAAARRMLLVVPLGSTEQHGPHLPLSTDTDIAVRAGDRRWRTAARRSWSHPQLAYGASGEHAGFPGTLSIGHEALELLLVELVRSADRTSGRVLLVNGHGGNADAVAGRSPAAAPEGTGRPRAGRPAGEAMPMPVAPRPPCSWRWGAAVGDRATGRARRTAARAAAATARPAECGRSAPTACWATRAVRARTRATALLDRSASTDLRGSRGAAGDPGRAGHRRRAGHRGRDGAGLAADGWAVVATDRCADDPRLPYALGTRDELEALAGRTGADAASPTPPRATDLAAAVASPRSRFGGLDAVIAVAGVVAGGVPLWEQARGRARRPCSTSTCTASSPWRARRIPALLRRPAPAVRPVRRGLLRGGDARPAAARGLLRREGRRRAGWSAVWPRSCAAPVSPRTASARGRPGPRCWRRARGSTAWRDVEEFARQQAIERLIEPEEVARRWCGWRAVSSGVTGADVA